MGATSSKGATWEPGFNGSSKTYTSYYKNIFETYTTYSEVDDKEQKKETLSGFYGSREI